MRTNEKTYKTVLLAMLLAVELIFAFTPLGYLRVGIVEITFMTLPVAIGAMLLDEYSSLFLGCVFGVTSFVQCFGISAFGTVCFSVNPFGTVVLCILPRCLMGYLAGLIFKLTSKIDKTKIVSFVLTAFSAAFLNTALFVLTFFLFFRNATLTIGEKPYDISAMNILDVAVFIAGVNGIVEIIACTLISAPIGKALMYSKKKLLD